MATSSTSSTALEQLQEISQLMASSGAAAAAAASQPSSPSRRGVNGFSTVTQQAAPAASQTAANEPILPVSSFGEPTAAAPAAASSSSDLLASHIASDSELQQSLRSFSASFSTSAAPVGGGANRRAFDLHAFASDISSMASSAMSTPALAPQPAPLSANTTAPAAAPSLPFPPFTSHYTAYSAQAQTHKQQLDENLARHEQALIAARQRLEAMGISSALPARFAKSSTGDERSVDEFASFQTSRAPSEAAEVPYRAAAPAPSRPFHSSTIQQHWRTAALHASAPSDMGDDTDAPATSGGEEEEEEESAPEPERRVQSAPRGRSVAPSAARAAAASTARTARPRSVTRHQAGGASTARTSSVPRGVKPASAGSHVPPRQSAAVSAARPISAAPAPRRSSPAHSPVRAPLPRSSPSKASASQHHSGSGSTSGGGGDLAAEWAERYKTLMHRNDTLTKKNKELTLRNQALQSSIQQLTSDVQQVTTQRDEAQQAAAATEEKLAACKSTLRSERESASFHVQKHLSAAETTHLSAVNRLKAEHDQVVEGLEHALAEARKRGKTLQLVAQGTQGKLDNKCAEMDKLERESAAHVEQLQRSLATSVAQNASVTSRLHRVESLLRDRESELRSTYSQLSETLTHAESLGSELVQAKQDRADLLKAFRELQAWTDLLVAPEGQLARDLQALQQEADKSKMAGEQYTQQVRALTQEQQLNGSRSSAGRDAYSVRSPPRSPTSRAALLPTTADRDRAHFSPRLSHSAAPPAPHAVSSSFASPAPPLRASHDPSPSPSTLLPQSTMLRQALQEDGKAAHRSPMPLMARSAFHTQVGEQTQQPTFGVTRASPTTSAYTTLKTDYPARDTSVQPSSSPSFQGDTLAQLQERLRRLNARSANL